MKRITLFSNGNTAVFDEDGKQMPELQEAWFNIFIKFLESQNVDPLECHFTLPSGCTAKPFITSEGHWNWEIN